MSVHYYSFINSFTILKRQFIIKDLSNESFRSKHFVKFKIKVRKKEFNKYLTFCLANQKRVLKKLEVNVRYL